MTPLFPISMQHFFNRYPINQFVPSGHETTTRFFFCLVLAVDFFLSPKIAKVYMGEGAGLIYSVDAAEKITRDVAREAEDQLDIVNRLRT